jgi:hypothetical protein
MVGFRRVTAEDRSSRMVGFCRVMVEGHSSLVGRIEVRPPNLRNHATYEMLPSTGIEALAARMLAVEDFGPLKKPPPMVGPCCRLHHETQMPGMTRDW